MLGRFGYAERVVDALQALVCADPQKGDRNVSVLAEMRAMISLHRGRSGEQEAYGNIPQQLATFMAAVTYAADGRNPWSTQTGRASCRDRVCQYVASVVVAVTVK